MRIIECLVNNGAKLNIKNDEGKTPLLIAMKVGNNEIANYLKNHGAEGGCRI